MFVMSAFRPSFVHNLHQPFNRSVEFRVYFVYSVSLLAVETWMEGTDDIPYKIPISSWLLNQIGKMQIISCSFKLLNLI